MNNEITSLSKGYDADIEEEYDISSFEQSELDSITSFYGDKFDTVDKLKARFKRVSGTLLDTTKNSHGFSLSSKGLQSIASHFDKTKDMPILHRKFLDHKFQEIEKQVGRVTKIWYDAKTDKLKYKGVDDKLHPTMARSDSFRSVSATIAHGDRSCSSCEKPYKSLHAANCSCSDAHPVSNRAMHIETSYVSFPAYNGATSQVDEFSTDVGVAVSSFFADLKLDNLDDPAPPKEDPPQDPPKDKEIPLEDKVDYNKLVGLIKDVKELREEIQRD